jgi:uncharacterized protein with HXXEE motif
MKNSNRLTDDLFRLTLLAPLIFVCHFLEESPSFVVWFNSHVTPGITAGVFWRVNITALVITIVIVVIEYFSRSAGSLMLVVGWFGFLMLANGAFHIVAGVVDRQYVPGLVTATLLYLPYYFLLFTHAVRARRANSAGLLSAATLCSLPMLIHGYLIVFRGARLF